MIRITLIDSKRVISFLGQEDMVPRLLASCCSNPGSLEELLLATEAFQRGITRAVFDGLIDFDRAVARLGTASQYQHAGDIENLKSVSNVFEAVEPALLDYARNGDGTIPILIIDLPSRKLSSSTALTVARADTVVVHDGEIATSRTVTYDLPAAWVIEALPVRPLSDI